jgi:HSP20 family protein
MLLEYPATRWSDPVTQMRRAQQDMNRLFGGLRLAPRAEYPPVNVWAGPDGAIVTTAVPGVALEEIDIAVHRDTVTLRGNRKPEEVGDPEAIIHRQEHIYGPFVRSIILPFRVDAEKTAARYSRGVLILELQRPVEDRPHKIKIARS